MAPNTAHLNEDELEAPKWLNAEFLADVLQRSGNDKTITVKDFELTPATFKGDHYASVMFRATVQYDTQQQKHLTKSLIIKTMPELEGMKKELLHESHIFETENDMYDVIIPRFERMLLAAGDTTMLAPHCIFHSLSPKKLIIFEDLVPQGYTVLRDRLPNLEEAKLAYQKLAKFHAASYKLIQEDAKCLNKYRHGMMTISNIINAEHMATGVETLIELLDEVPTLRVYKKYFEPMRGKLIPKCKASFTEYWNNRQKNTSYVLCHGDFHFKNLMFKHEPQTQKLQDIVMLDYQLSYMGPQVIDIIYATYMMLGTKLRTEHLDELIHHYFTHFIETLKRIGYAGQLPKLLEFRQQLIEHRHFEIYLLVTFLPIWHGFHDGTSDMDKMVSSAEYRKTLYRNQLFLDDLHQLLPKYLQLGYFEE